MRTWMALGSVVARNPVLRFWYRALDWLAWRWWTLPDPVAWPVFRQIDAAFGRAYWALLAVITREIGE